MDPIAKPAAPPSSEPELADLHTAFDRRYEQLRSGTEIYRALPAEQIEKMRAGHDAAAASLSSKAAGERLVTGKSHSGDWITRGDRTLLADADSAKFPARLSCNIFLTPEALSELDAVIIKHNAPAAYKIPRCPNEQNDNYIFRHDNLTIYLTEHTPKEFIAEVAAWAGKHARSVGGQDFLIGEQLAVGCAYQRHLPKYLYQELLPVLRQVDPSLGAIFAAKLAESSKAELSAGYWHVIRELAEERGIQIEVQQNLLVLHDKHVIPVKSLPVGLERFTNWEDAQSYYHCAPEVLTRIFDDQLPPRPQRAEALVDAFAKLLTRDSSMEEGRQPDLVLGVVTALRSRELTPYAQHVLRCLVLHEVAIGIRTAGVDEVMDHQAEERLTLDQNIGHQITLSSTRKQRTRLPDGKVVMARVPVTIDDHVHELLEHAHAIYLFQRHGIEIAPIWTALLAAGGMDQKAPDSVLCLREIGTTLMKESSIPKDSMQVFWTDNSSDLQGTNVGSLDTLPMYLMGLELRRQVHQQQQGASCYTPVSESARTPQNIQDIASGCLPENDVSMLRAMAVEE